MTPELLSRQTRQTRLALMLFSALSIGMFLFCGTIDVENGVSLFGISIQLSEEALHLMLVGLILYLLSSFLISAFSDRLGAGIQPREQAIAYRIDRLNDSYNRLEQGLRVDTLQCLLKAKTPFILACIALNKIYDSEIAPEELVSLIDRSADVASSQKINRLEELAVLESELRNLQLLDMSLNRVKESYEYSRGKSFGRTQHLIGHEQLEDISLQESKRCSEKYADATRHCEQIKKIADEVIQKILKETESKKNYVQRLIQFEDEISSVEETTRFSMRFSFSFQFVNYMILDFLFPIGLGVLGLASAVFLALR